MAPSHTSQGALRVFLAHQVSIRDLEAQGDTVPMLQPLPTAQQNLHVVS